MKTIWGERLDPQNILPDYPRPQMRREKWVNLNGEWEYAFTDSIKRPAAWSGKILVPFSPECELSGVGTMLKPGGFLWYRRTFTLPRGWNRSRVLLHFGAVDQSCEVYVNGRCAGTHTGGYTAFTLDITELLQRGENELSLCAEDRSDTSFFSRGKQKLARGGIWYTPQSGIWQSVWLEPVPEKHVKRLVITPLFDQKAVQVTVESDADAVCSVTAAGITVRGRTNQPILVSAGNCEPWTPETPNLYALTVKLGSDRIESYFGMRKFEVREDESGKPRFFLNNRPYFNNGVLDQGYWSDGLLTAPSDDAMISDIRYMKSLGFNMLRKHIKIEPMRWYYHCDRIGMLVWQDMVNGGGPYKTSIVTLPVLFGGSHRDDDYRAFARENPLGRAQYLAEMEETVRQLQNVTCLAVWVPFNEGWGQFDALKACEKIDALDGTRPIDHASGWHDQGGGSFRSLRVYFRPYRFRPDKGGRAVALTEFGGYALRVDGHTFSESDFGYRRFKNKQELVEGFRRLYEKEILPAKEKGLCASVYTQLSDVEDELNGFVTYDRRVRKIQPAEVRDILEKLND